MSVLALIGILIVAAIVSIMIVIKSLYICGPNEVLIFSGQCHKESAGIIGYKAIKGGRKVKLPLFEIVDRLDLTNMNIGISVKGAFSKGGIPLNVDGVANVKIAGEQPLLNNAVERLLGKERQQIMNIAKETLEGNLRGVLATMTPEEVNSDKIRFAHELMEEADSDLHKLGLELDTMKIQNVSDERGYLDSIGRISGAQVRKNAELAEASNKSESTIRDAKNNEQAEIVSIEAAMKTLEAKMQCAIVDAESQKEALIAEARGKIQAEIAEAQSSLDVQKARIEQVREQLEADIVAPAKAAMQADMERAKGDAAKIIEDGKATTNALKQVAGAWKIAGDNARDVFLLQKFESLVKTLMQTLTAVQINKVSVLGTSSVQNNETDLVKGLIGASEKIKATLGVDVFSRISSPK